MNGDPLSVLVQVLASLVGVLVLRWLDRRKNRKVQAKAEEATVQATKAAEQSTIAASRSAESTKSNAATEQALMFMAEQLGKSQASRDREADWANEALARYLKLAVLIEGEQLPERMRALEEFAAARETEEHKQGSPER